MSITGDEPRIVVLTRPGCHLCEQAIEVIDAVCAETGDSYEERNVDRDPEPADATAIVPVTFVDGRQHDFWRLMPTACARRCGPDVFVHPSQAPRGKQLGLSRAVDRGVA